MTKTPKRQTLRYDRPSETVIANRLKRAPWSTKGQRGALDLSRDGSAHRKSHSLFEDMQN